MSYNFIDFRKFAILVAGGSGSRMNNTLPKQFIEINGLPVLMHTVNAFYNYDPFTTVIVVLPGKEITRWNNLCTKYNFKIKHKIVCGGETRFHSVKNGLESISDDGIVFIHDGVRPLVATSTIERCYKTAAEKGNALPVISPSESLRKVSDNKNMAVNRKNYFLVQTPQTFRVSAIKKAYQLSYNKNFTDDASVFENAGEAIYMVEGNRENLKITFPADILIAKAFMSKSR